MGDSLENISPIDGRYNSRTRELVPFFSEKALIQYRMLVEGEYLIFLSERGEVNLRKFSENEIKFIDDMVNNVCLEDAQRVKQFEKTTNHDVKAVEYFMKEELSPSSLNDIKEWIHFGLTSYDINNIALTLIIRDFAERIALPKIKSIYNAIDELALTYSNTPMLARTHGQPASPTTFGKEMKVFSNRVDKQMNDLENSELDVKLNGATGNYNAHTAAYPNIDWVQFTSDFVERLKDINYNPGGKYMINITPNFVTTQIEPYDSMIKFFDNFKRLNTILIDFNRDMWQYISDSWIVQKPKEGEVGSSTMPHKVNPIDFENSEGNLYMANALFTMFGERLPVSRLQRDLSGSTIERNIGVAFAHSIIAYDSLLKGLGKIKIDQDKMLVALNQHPEIITEGIQTILRREGMNEPYEKLSKFSRGNSITLTDIYNFVKGLEISEELKSEIYMLQPTTYTGLAEKIVKNADKY